MTDAERLKKLLDAVDEADRLELDILQAAVGSTRSAYQKASTAANKKDWDVAKEGPARRDRPALVGLHGAGRTL